jgi:mono/diheme cytochrome c family protein
MQGEVRTGMTRRALFLLVVGGGTAAAAAFTGHLMTNRASLKQIPTVTLTAIMAQGIWTDEEVTAANSWRRDFRVARPVLRRGETVRLRLASADVVHSFAAPGLGIERTEVYPGRVVDVVVTPGEARTFEYYCTTVCGEAHFAMRGFLRVVDEGQLSEALPVRPGGRYWQATAPTGNGAPSAIGAWHFRQKGCVTCHGEGGRGGVPNPNSMNEVVPELATLARRTFLFTRADVAAFRELLASGTQLDRVQAVPDVSLFTSVKTQYLALRQLVREGRRSAKLQPSGPRPPLDMPAWESRLTDEEIDKILAYLLSLSEADDGSLADPRSSTRKGEVQ